MCWWQENGLIWINIWFSRIPWRKCRWRMMVPRFFAMGAVTQCLGLATIASVGEELLGFSFVLHKSCAEVPDEIHHPIHRKHPLTLARILMEEICSVCNQDCSERIYYSCFQCEFNIDLQCASNWSKILDCHNHKFTHHRKPAQLPCEACGRDSIRISSSDRYNSALYLCSICQLLVHKDCSWLPSHVKTAQHPHRLKLTWWFEDTFPKIQNFCDETLLQFGFISRGFH